MALAMDDNPAVSTTVTVIVQPGLLSQMHMEDAVGFGDRVRPRYRSISSGALPPAQSGTEDPAARVDRLFVKRMACTFSSGARPSQFVVEPGTGEADPKSHAVDKHSV